MKLLLVLMFFINVYAGDYPISINEDNPTCKNVLINLDETAKNGGNTRSLIHKRKRIEIFFGKDWSYVGCDDFNKSDIGRSGEYIYFLVLIKNGYCVFWDKKYDKNNLKKMFDVINDINVTKKVCFSIYIDEEVYDEPFYKIWGIVFQLHKFSQNRVLYSRAVNLKIK